MRNGNSRTADKFVIRLPDGVRSRVEDAAKADHTSMNTFFVQAVEEKLARPTRQALLWSVHYQILSIFEGDANTKLPCDPAEVSA